mmetsp:Transcript_67984/g.151835  ORF Transcript_67984/g.151835 Transcript_67984/m.151835 type:complete len:255 (+) Transcript_67984:251-1015(+)
MAHRAPMVDPLHVRQWTWHALPARAPLTSSLRTVRFRLQPPAFIPGACWRIQAAWRRVVPQPCPESAGGAAGGARPGLRPPPEMVRVPPTPSRTHVVRPRADRVAQEIEVPEHALVEVAVDEIPAVPSEVLRVVEGALHLEEAGCRPRRYLLEQRPHERPVGTNLVRRADAVEAGMCRPAAVPKQPHRVSVQRAAWACQPQPTIDRRGMVKEADEQRRRLEQRGGVEPPGLCREHRCGEVNVQVGVEDELVPRE